MIVKMAKHFLCRYLLKQFDYINYEGMGVPIQLDVLERSRKPSKDDLFPYFYDRIITNLLLNIQTTNEDYERALQIERAGCCVTTIEYAQHETSIIQASFQLIENLMICSFFCNNISTHVI